MARFNGSVDSKTPVPSVGSSGPNLPEPFKTFAFKLEASVKRVAECERKTREAEDEIALNTENSQGEDSTTQEVKSNRRSHLWECFRLECEADHVLVPLKRTILEEILMPKIEIPMELVRFNFPWILMKANYGFSFHPLISNGESFSSVLMRETLQKCITEIRLEEEKIKKRLGI